MLGEVVIGNADFPFIFSFPSGVAGVWMVGCLVMDFD